MAKATKTNWKDVESEMLSETISRKMIYGDKVMVSEILLKKGTVVPEHHHESEQVSWIMKGELLFEIGGEKISVKEGDVLVIPSNTPHKATALEDTIDMDLFSPIRYDWIKKDDQYLRGGEQA